MIHFRARVMKLFARTLGGHGGDEILVGYEDCAGAGWKGEFVVRKDRVQLQIGDEFEVDYQRDKDGPSEVQKEILREGFKRGLLLAKNLCREAQRNCLPGDLARVGAENCEKFIDDALNVHATAVDSARQGPVKANTGTADTTSNAGTPAGETRRTS